MLKKISSWIKDKSDSKIIPICLLGGYLVYLSCYYYYLCVNSQRLSNLFVKASQMDVFRNLASCLGSDIVPFIHLKNYIYTLLFYSFDNSLFVYLATSFVMYLICCILIYILANSYTPNKYYGLLAVVIFSFYSDIMLHVFAVNVHISETFHVLIILYFWHKSNCFTHIRYSLLYVIFTIFSLCARFSIFGYFITFLVFTSYSAIKRKSFNFLIYNSILLVFLVKVIFNAGRKSFLIDKLYNVNLFLSFDFSGKMTFLTDLFMQYVSHMYIEIPTLYFYLILGCIFLRIFYPYKRKTELFEAVNACIMVFFGFYFLVFIPKGYEIADTLKYDIACYDSIPVWALLSVGFINYFVSYAAFLRSINKYILKIIILFIVVKALLFESICHMPAYIKMQTTSHMTGALSYYSKFKYLIKYFKTISAGREAKQYLFIFKPYWIDIKKKKTTDLDTVLSDEFFEFFYDIATMEGFQTYTVKNDQKQGFDKLLGYNLIRDDIALLVYKNTSYMCFDENNFSFRSKFTFLIGPVRLEMFVYENDIFIN